MSDDNGIDFEVRTMTNTLSWPHHPPQLNPCLLSQLASYDAASILIWPCWEDIGFCEVNLHDIYLNGDWVDRRVAVLDKNDQVLATVVVSLVAQSALRAVLAD